MEALDDDALLSVLRRASGHTLSQAMMSCRRLCGFLRRRDELWGRLLRRPACVVVDEVQRIPRGRRPCGFAGNPNRYLYSLAYASLKFAVRIARLEYSTNGVLMKDCVLCVVSLMASVHDDSTVAEQAHLTRAWLAAEGCLLRFPIGTYFDAVEAFGSLEGPLAVVLMGMRQVAVNPALNSPVCRLRLSDRGGSAERDRRHRDRVWELKRVVRRIGFLLKVGRQAMGVLRRRP